MKARITRTLHGFDARSLLLFASLSAGAGMALAQSTPAAGRSAPGSASTTTAQVASAPTVQDAFRRADTNQDGKLTLREAERFPAIAERFSQLDKDKNGSLSLQEFAQGAAHE